MTAHDRTSSRSWLAQYPDGVPAEIDPSSCPTLVALLDEAFTRHEQRVAFRFLGRSLSFGRIAEASRALAAWLQSRGVARGDRVAVMLPNVPQYAVAVAAVLRAGAVVVNIDPHHTPRELQHQLQDSGAGTLLMMEGAAAVFEAIADTVPLRTVVLASMGDMLGPIRRAFANHVARRAHPAAPAHRLPGAVRFSAALRAGATLPLKPPPIGPEDIALLQYTGGTTGVCKGVVLLHRNLAANVLQCEAWYRPAMRRVRKGEPVVWAAVLPLHHLFGFTAGLLLSLRAGGCCLLIPDARDVGALLRTLSREVFHGVAAVDALFNAIVDHPGVERVDWSHLRLSVGGGMPVHATTARRWLERTGCPIVEGYGLTETSPTATCNPVDGSGQAGSIGLPLPSTEVALLDEAGEPVTAPGATGEIAIRGPQVMAGYWQRPDETAKVMTADGWLRTGDIGSFDAQGYLRVVDRLKDMILVSGFNVYPNEVEHVVAQLPGVLECAAVGVADARAGETVKLVVVRRDAALTEADVRAHCETHLTGYKRPRVVEFRSALPKTAVGKVLRRELRDAA